MSDSFSSLRQAANLSIPDVASFLHLPIEDIEAFENGSEEPSLDSILALKGLSLLKAPPRLAKIMPTSTLKQIQTQKIHPISRKILSITVSRKT